MASSERIFALLDTPVEIESGFGARGSGFVRLIPMPPGCQRASNASRESRTPIPNPGDDPLRARDLRLRRRRAGAQGRLVRSAARAARRHRRCHRLRQDDDHEPAAAVLRRAAADASPIDGVDIREMDLRAAARDVRHGAAGRAPVLRARLPTTCASATRAIDEAAVRRALEAVHADRFVDRLPRGDGDHGCRAGCVAVGRAEAAAVVRARARVRSAGPDPGRGDVERRHRDRAADPRCARRDHARPDHASPSRTACRRFSTWIASSSCTRDSCARRARTTSCWRSAASTTACSSCSFRTGSERKRRGASDSARGGCQGITAACVSAEAGMTVALSISAGGMPAGGGAAGRGGVSPTRDAGTGG